MHKLFDRLTSLRIEEAIAILFFVPMIMFTSRAYLYFYMNHDHIPTRISGGLHRIWITVALFVLFLLIIRAKKNWKFIRDWLPFGFCIAIYTNLHDTIHFVNKNDIHDILINIDQWMFGVQPCVWAQKFIHPVLTDIFIATYANYFILVIIVPLALYIRKSNKEFRYTLLSIIVCYYIGYFLFILFPAAPPRLVLKPMFTLSLHGNLLDPISHSILSASSSRGAFPSLHCAVSLLALFFAWRYIRWLFYVMLPLVILLIVSTVYLRHHYVIDLIAGGMLSLAVFRIGPLLEDFWENIGERRS